MASSAPDRYTILRAFARENRKNMTLAERVLWEELRSNRMGMKFYRQHIVADYIVDFMCHDCGLIIEVDGGYHSEPQQEVADDMRDQRLNDLGYHIMRFSNEEVLYETDSVLETIWAFFD